MLLKFGVVILSLIAGTQWQDELNQINSHITQLEELQDKLRSRAQKNANNAMRWQFQSENYRDARRAWESAAQDKQKIEEIQTQLDILQQRKQRILKEHGTEASP